MIGCISYRGSDIDRSARGRWVVVPPVTKPLAVDPAQCVECAACVPVCAFDAIFLRGWGIEILEDECTLCGVCVQVCPTGALIRHGV